MTPRDTSGSVSGCQCPKCGKRFGGPSIGSHAGKCGVTEVQLFWSKVKMGGPVDCWEWTGAKNDDGYGHFRNSEKRTKNAHKFSYELVNGPIPKGLCAMHSCDNRACVNPAHMSLGTHHENMIDAMKKKRHVYGERNIHAKLTEDDVRAIRQTYWCKGKRSNAKELAAKYGVKHGAIVNAANGHYWKHV